MRTHSLLPVHLSASTSIWPGFPSAGFWLSLKINWETKTWIELNCQSKGKTVTPQSASFPGHMCTHWHSKFTLDLDNRWQNNLTSRSILQLLIISHDLHQQMKFAQLSWNDSLDLDLDSLDSLKFFFPEHFLEHCLLWIPLRYNLYQIISLTSRSVLQEQRKNIQPDGTDNFSD